MSRTCTILLVLTIPLVSAANSTTTMTTIATTDIVAIVFGLVGTIVGTIGLVQACCAAISARKANEIASENLDVDAAALEEARQANVMVDESSRVAQSFVHLQNGNELTRDQFAFLMERSLFDRISGNETLLTSAIRRGLSATAMRLVRGVFDDADPPEYGQAANIEQTVLYTQDVVCPLELAFRLQRDNVCARIVTRLGGTLTESQLQEFAQRAIYGGALQHTFEALANAAQQQNIDFANLVVRRRLSDDEYRQKVEQSGAPPEEEHTVSKTDPASIVDTLEWVRDELHDLLDGDSGAEQWARLERLCNMQQFV